MISFWSFRFLWIKKKKNFLGTVNVHPSARVTVHD